jgi:hypothetical protein
MLRREFVHGRDNGRGAALGCITVDLEMKNAIYPDCSEINIGSGIGHECGNHAPIVVRQEASGPQELTIERAEAATIKVENRKDDAGWIWNVLAALDGKDC